MNLPPGIRLNGETKKPIPNVVKSATESLLRFEQNHEGRSVQMWFNHRDEPSEANPRAVLEHRRSTPRTQHPTRTRNTMNHTYQDLTDVISLSTGHAKSIVNDVLSWLDRNPAVMPKQTVTDGWLLSVLADYGASFNTREETAKLLNLDLVPGPAPSTEGLQDKLTEWIKALDDENPEADGE